jgi:hypothetical protein
MMMKQTIHRVKTRELSPVIPGWCVSTRPGISRFSDVQLYIVVRCFASPRNDGTEQQKFTRRIP